LKIDSPDELIEQLTLHRLNVRNIFEDILSEPPVVAAG
jgi:hypothetical protein